MVQWIDYYIDDNETIYVHVEESSATVNDTSGFNITFDLSMISELSGQSTVFLNSARFGVNGWNKDTATTSDVILYAVAGIVPVDYITSSATGLPTLSDYQEVKGWPLKGCYGTPTVGRGRDSDVLPADWQGAVGRVTWTKSYKPRAALLISRLQAVTLCASHTQQGGFSSADWDGALTMDFQLKRGD